MADTSGDRIAAWQADTEDLLGWLTPRSLNGWVHPRGHVYGERIIIQGDEVFH